MIIPLKTLVEIREHLFGPLFGYKTNYENDQIDGLLQHVATTYNEKATAYFRYIEDSFWLEDIKYGSVYLDTLEVTKYAELYGFQRAPLLFSGSYAPCLDEQFSKGRTVIAPSSMIKNPIKERLGIRIIPQKEMIIDKKRIQKFVLNPEVDNAVSNISSDSKETST